jgi:hypothetical protein
MAPFNAGTEQLIREGEGDDIPNKQFSTADAFHE